MRDIAVRPAEPRRVEVTADDVIGPDTWRVDAPEVSEVDRRVLELAKDRIRRSPAYQEELIRRVIERQTGRRA